VVGVGAAAVQDGQRALPEEAVQAALPRIEQFANLGLGEVLEAAPRADAGVNEFRNDNTAFHERLPGRLGDPISYGRMSIGALSGVSNQTSTMSAFDRAMQPSVQSL